MADGRRMPYMVAGLLLAAACSPVRPTPNDFPPPPLTPIVEFPTGPASTATPRPIAKPIFTDDMADARTFFLILKVAVTAGDSTSIAERVLYPIQVRVHGQPTTISSPAEFERSYDSIFSRAVQEAIGSADENDLVLTLDGIQAADGLLWFGQFCADPPCLKGEFLITQIDN